MIRGDEAEQNRKVEKQRAEIVAVGKAYSASFYARLNTGSPEQDELLHTRA